MNQEKQYRLFSRKTGWPGGVPCRYFSSSKISATDDMIDLTGRQIIQKYKDDISEDTYKACSIYFNWYLYKDDTVITSAMSL